MKDRTSPIKTEKASRKGYPRLSAQRSDGEVRFDEDNKPGVSNLLSIYSAVTDESTADLENRYAGQGCGALKSF